MSKLHSIEDLFKHELSDLYSAETQLIEALPLMAEAADDEKLKQAFEEHLEETEEQKTRLEEIADICGFDITGHTCEAMQGLVQESQEIIEADADETVRDAGLIGAAQRVEHYEIAGYGTAHALALELGYEDVAELLQETLEEEKSADQLLNQIALNRVNQKASGE